MQAHRLCVLHGELPETADAGDCQPLSRPCLGFLDALVSGDPGAKDRRHFGEIRLLGQAAYIRRSADDVLGKAAVYAVAGVVLRVTEAVPAGHAILASTTCIVQPGNARVIAFLQADDVRAARRDDPDAFMAGDKRQRRLCRPIAVGGMQVGVTDAARNDLDQNLARPRGGNRNFLDAQRLAERVHHAGSHRFRHKNTSLF